MKIFALYTNLNLIEKPVWLDEFRSKFDEPWDFHITLKQPCYIAEEDIPKMKSLLDSFLASGHQWDASTPVILDALRYDTDEDGTVIMLDMQNAGALQEFQKKLCSVLGTYSQYVKPYYQGYEEDFRPHITIGRDLLGDRYAEAMKYLENGCYCEGIIDQLGMTMVNNMSVGEATNPANQTFYKL